MSPLGQSAAEQCFFDSIMTHTYDDSDRVLPWQPNSEREAPSPVILKSAALNSDTGLLTNLIPLQGFHG